MLEGLNAAPPGNVIGDGWIVVDETDGTFLSETLGGADGALFGSPVEAARILYRHMPFNPDSKLRIKKVRLHDTGRWDIVNKWGRDNA